MPAARGTPPDPAGAAGMPGGRQVSSSLVLLKERSCCCANVNAVSSLRVKGVDRRRSRDHPRALGQRIELMRARLVGRVADTNQREKRAMEDSHRSPDNDNASQTF